MYQNRFGGWVLPDPLGELTCSPRPQPQWGGLLIMGGKEGEGRLLLRGKEGWKGRIEGMEREKKETEMKLGHIL